MRVPPPLLRRAVLKHLTRHRWQAACAIVGVALGVAVFVAIDLANASAVASFEQSTETVFGRATHRVVGGPAGLDERVATRLVRELGLTAAPVLETPTRLISPPQPRDRAPRVLRLFGIDPLAEIPFRPFLGRSAVAGGSDRSKSIDLPRFLLDPQAALLAAETARELGLSVGDRFKIRLGAASQTLTLAGTFAPDDPAAQSAVADLLVVDLATAQELQGKLGVLSHLDLDLAGDDQAIASELSRIRAILPADAEVVTTAARARETLAMTRAFRTNLAALSLLALVCGAFLIYNTLRFAVVQRRTLFGTLRALGTTRGEILGLVLTEALGIGVLGTALGIGAGVVIGRGLLRLVTQTINDLYFVLDVQGLAISPRTFGLALLLGLGATLAAALGPALEATTVAPRAALLRSDLEFRSRRGLLRAATLGLLLILSGAALLVASSRIASSFAALFLVLLGWALICPPLTVAALSLIRRPLGALFGPLGRMAAGGVEAGLSRTGVAIAALAVAIAVAVGVGTTISSFRGSVSRWLRLSLPSDLYVAPAVGGGGFLGADLPRSLEQLALSIPGVERVRTVRRAEVSSPRGVVRLVAVDPEPDSIDLSTLGDRAEVWRRFARGEGVLASEPLARRLGLTVGDSLTLRTAQGPRAFPVLATYVDYASDRGIVMFDAAAYQRLFRDPRISGLSIDVDANADPYAVGREFRRRAALEPEPLLLAIQSSRELLRASLAVFDRTFLVTSVLRTLAGVVAFLGVLAALLARELERTRELAVLRALGLTPAQVTVLIAGETGILGLAAGLLALPLGIALAWMLLEVVNRRSFGWSADLVVTPGPLFAAVGLALLAAGLASLGPAFRMARTPPALALRDE